MYPIKLLKCFLSAAVYSALFFGCAAQNQKFAKDEVEIMLPAALRNPRMEFSSMAWDKERLLLMPQFPDTFKNEMYALSRADVTAAITSGAEITTAQTIKVQNLKEIKRIIGPTYEGFESVVVLGDKIFFTLETKAANPNCFLIKGTVSALNITLDAEKIILLPKLKRLSNAGFESMGYLKKLNKLVIFFEYNKADVGSKALLMHTSLTQPPTMLPLDPLMYRLTDVTAIAPDKLLGINYYFNASKTEFSEYIGADSLFSEPALAGKALKQSSFTRILELNVKATISWKPRRIISLKPENWEGIAPFKNGVLLITDTFPGSVLKWFRISN